MSPYFLMCLESYETAAAVLVLFYHGHREFAFILLRMAMLP